MNLVWKKENLPPSDAKYNLRFTRGEKIHGQFIDPKTDFRYKIFDKLDWKPRGKESNQEDACANFEIEIEGKSRDFRLKINHKYKPDKDQKYTRIYWGEAKSVITEQNIKGKTLSLFQIEGKPDSFLIKIESTSGVIPLEKA